METFFEFLAIHESAEEEQGFIQALVQNPYDANAWLIYADWLADQGDPRAEVIRKFKRANQKPPRRGATNMMGEREYQTYASWRKGVFNMFPIATFQGNKDIAQAFCFGRSVGEWDGATGSIYTWSW
jgi:uncharacterized protein (TIGR02996 family)